MIDNDKLVKVKTQKEIYYREENIEGAKENIIATSKSYIYLAKGLSDELSDEQNSCNNGGPNNYRSAFFENDRDLEDYHRQLKEALLAQFQKEATITSHEQIKTYYEDWVSRYQETYKKTSPCKNILLSPTHSCV
jgi:hypothetical protein